MLEVLKGNELLFIPSLQSFICSSRRYFTKITNAKHPACCIIYLGGKRMQKYHSTYQIFLYCQQFCSTNHVQRFLISLETEHKIKTGSC